MFELKFGEPEWIQDEEIEDLIFSMLSWTASMRTTNLLVCKNVKGSQKYVNFHDISQDLLEEIKEGSIVFIGSLRQLSQILAGEIQEDCRSISVVLIDSEGVQAAEYDWDAGLYLWSGMTATFKKKVEQWLQKQQNLKDF